MTKLELLKEKLVMLATLIGKEDDEAKQKKYIEQRDAVNVEIGKQIAIDEATAKALKDAEELQAKVDKGLMIDKSKQSVLNEQPVIKVGDPEMYKGFNLKEVIGEIDSQEGVSTAVKARLAKNPEKGFKMLAMFADLHEKAYTMSPAQVKAMQEGTDSEGGYLTPTEQRAELFSYIREQSIVAPDVTHISMKSDVMEIPRELTNVTVAWTAEESEATDTTPAFDQVTLTAKRLDAQSTSSNELLEDTNVPGGITAVLLSQFTEAVAKEIDKQVLVGTGSPTSGVFTAQAGYSAVFASGSTAFSKLLEADIRALIAQIPSERLDGAKWYMNHSVLWNYFNGLKDTTGRPLFVPSMSAGSPDLVWGYPVKTSSQATSASAAGATMAAFGNLKGFVIGDRLTNIKLLADPYTLGAKYQTKFYFFTRWAFAHALPGNYGRIVTAAS